MKAASILALAVLACLAAPAQTSPPPLCFAFNDSGTPPVFGSGGLPATCPGASWVHFTAPASATVNSIEAYVMDIAIGVRFAFDVYQTAGLGVQPSGAALATLTAPTFPPGWQALTTPGAFSFGFVAGATYAFLIKAYSTVPQMVPCNAICVSLGVNPAGATPLLYQNASPTGCGGWPTGPLGLMLRFRGVSCGPGPPASVVNALPYGWCGHSTSNDLASLLTQTPPVLGAPWTVSLTKPGGGTAHLFWSSGLNLAGAPISAGSTCLHYLDEASVAALAAAGAEPLVSGTIPPIYPSVLFWNFTIPSSPAYAGLLIGTQALVVSSTGTIPLGGGLLAQTSNALLLTLGY